MASSVQGVSCIRKKECRDVLSGHWSATRSCSMRFLKMSGKRQLVQLSLFTTYCFNFLISLFCEISSSPHNVDYHIMLIISWTQYTILGPRLYTQCTDFFFFQVITENAFVSLMIMSYAIVYVCIISSRALTPTGILK